MMIFVFALAGTFTATIAGVTALVMGQSWWIGLASYMAVGMLTVFVLAVFVGLALKAVPRKADAQPVRARMPLAEH
jgi:heme/copper-type cytochrome/quinol oxidase subunit 2